MVKSIMGLYLIDAPFSALNMMGQDAGDRTDNITRTKTIRRGSEVFPYVSGQAVRYWWRSVLEREKKWKLSPIEREKKIAFTAADPVKYPDDDAFGYMKAPSGRNKETLTRVSPLKVSPLISCFPTRPTEDFGVMSRHSGDPVPYEHEFYSSILKGIFSLDLGSLGRFHNISRSGFQNLPQSIPDEMKNGMSKVGESDNYWEISKEERIKRAIDIIEVIPFLAGGAKLATHYTDVSPKFLVLAITDIGYHSFYHMIGNSDSKITLNKEFLTKFVQDYKERIFTKIYIGKEPGFYDEWNNLLQEMATDNKNVLIGSIKESVTQFITEMKKTDF